MLEKNQPGMESEGGREGNRKRKKTNMYIYNDGYRKVKTKTVIDRYKTGLFVLGG